MLLTFVNFTVSAHNSTSQQPCSTIITSIVHSKLDYCNSLYQHNRLQHIHALQNSLARAVKAPKSSHETLFHGWPIMVNDTHTRRRRILTCHSHSQNLSTGWRSTKLTNALNINFFLVLTTFLQPVKPIAVLTISVQQPRSIPAPHLLSPFLRVKIKGVLQGGGGHD